MPTKRKPRQQSYLDRLKFEPKMMTSFVAKYIQNIRLVFLLLITVALLGIVAFTQLPKRLNPEVEIPIVTVVTVLPGAGSADVESLVTIPIENELRSLEGIDTITSSSVDNASIVTIQFISSVDRDIAKDDVQSAVDGVTDLPGDAQDPRVTALDFEDQPVWIFSLVSSKSFPDLMNTASELKETVLDLPKVDRVQTTGFDRQEIVVEVSPQKLTDYGLNAFQLSQLIKQSRASYPAGVVETSQNTFSLTIDPQVESIQDIRSLPLSVQGKTLSLSDLATISQRSKVGQQLSFVASPESESQQAVTFYVYKTLTADIDAAGEEVQQSVDEFMTQQGDGYQIISLVNTSQEISDQFTDLLGEFRTTILLVMGVLLLFLGLRQALISSLTVPLTFLSAFFLMQLAGMSINFLSLFAFLLALGLLVDDTIVVVSAMTQYFKTGKFTPVQTGILVWKDTIIPIWSTTLTTIWSFVPLLITSGIIGEFIKPIPIVVTATMISSTGIAVLITLPLMIILLNPSVAPRVLNLLKLLAFVGLLILVGFLTFQSPIFPLALVSYLLLTAVVWLALPFAKKQFQTVITAKTPSQKTLQFTKVRTSLNQIMNQGVIHLESFSQTYKRFMIRVLTKKISRRKVLIGVVAYSVFSFLLLPLGFVKNEFFPKVDVEQLYVQLEMPAGTRLEITTHQALEILDTLRDTPEAQFVTAEVGRGGGSGFGDSSEASNLVYFTIRLTDVEDRSLPSFDIAEQLRDEFADYQAGKISVIEESGGPPAGADLQVTLLGDELSELNTQADRIVEYLESNSNVTNVNKSVREGTSKVVFVPDDRKLVEKGVGVDGLGFSLRTFASGFNLDEFALEEGDREKTDVVLRLDTGTADIQDISQLAVTNNQGQNVPLLELGHLEAKVNPTSIQREDFQRSLTVTAAVRSGNSVSEENKKLETFAESLDLPDGYSWKTGGVNEENNESVQSILQAMVLSAVLIMITMVVQFGSFRQAAIVLLVIPLAVSSVFLAFALTGTPLSFPALIGVLSLFGIVVTNSMFIVDKINLNRNEGMSFTESIADAGASRMEPIILTKLSTVFGLLPITLADPLWRGLGGAIISGLLMASTIMLLFIPVLYYDWMKESDR